jgi:hypothetical protein
MMKILKITFVVLLLVAFSIFVGFDLSAQKAQTTGKPDKPPGQDKPPKEEPCNNDFVCDAWET